jgi:Zn-dependent protease with chaperone function
VTRSWDLSKLTADDEARIGLALHSLVASVSPPLPGGPWVDRIQAAQESLCRSSTIRQSRYEYRVFVLDSDIFNAFSHPGGYIYVSRALIDAFGQDEPYGLEFALAHEMAHVEAHDALACLQFRDMKELAEKEKLGTAEMIFGLVIPRGYTREMEFAADRWALQRMAELDEYGRREALDFLRKLVGRARIDRFSQGELPLDPNLSPNPLDNHIRALVSAQTRLSRATEFWGSRAAPRR